MLKHKIEQSSDDTWSLLIQVDRLDDLGADKLGDYLITHVDSLFTDSRIGSHAWRDVRLKMGNQTRSERVIWALAAESKRATTMVSRYVDRLCDLTGEESLPFCDEEFPLGSFALLEYLNRNHGATEVLDAFCEFLMHCDMDHETWQNRYVQDVFSHNVADDLSRLFFTRVFGNGGQEWDSFLSGRKLSFTLNCQAPLKSVIDYMLASDNRDMKTARRAYEFLARAAYGSDEEKCEATVNYASASLASQDFQLAEDEVYEFFFDDECIARVREQADTALPNIRCDLDSGFFKREDGVWHRVG